jgi:hypothetical protein
VFIVSKRGWMFLASWEKSVTVKALEFASTAWRRSVFVTNLKLDRREVGSQCIELCMQDCLLCEICEHITVLTDFLAQVTYSSFQSPLCIARQGTCTKRFWPDVGK